MEWGFTHPRRVTVSINGAYLQFGLCAAILKLQFILLRKGGSMRNSDDADI